jgi:hypothetical protein
MQWKRKLARYLAKSALKIDAHSATLAFMEGQRGIILGNDTSCTVEWVGEVTGCYIFGGDSKIDLNRGVTTTYRKVERK